MAATEDLYQAWYRLYGVCVCRRADARLVLLIHAGGRFVLDLGVEVTSDVGMTLIRCVAFESALSFSLSAGPLLSRSLQSFSRHSGSFFRPPNDCTRNFQAISRYFQAYRKPFGGI